MIYLLFPYPQLEFLAWEDAMEHLDHLPSRSRWLQILPQLETSPGHLLLEEEKDDYLLENKQLPANLEHSV